MAKTTKNQKEATDAGFFGTTDDDEDYTVAGVTKQTGAKTTSSSKSSESKSS